MTEDAPGQQVDVAVLGAGMVGISAGLAARQRGLSVIVVDRREPGSETSYGNAGILSSGSIFPLNTPALWKNLPKYLTNQHPALRWNIPWAIANAGWVMRFLASTAPSQTKPRAVALRGLIGTSLKLHRGWIVQAGAGSRIRETGWLKAWRGDGLANARAEQAALAEFGIKSEVLDRQAISALEPNIIPAYSVGLLHTQTASVDSPGAVVKDYASMLAAGGGVIRLSEIRRIAPQGDGWRVQLGDGEIAARHVVVALGPWSAELLRPLGYRVPLAFERGYHQHFAPNPARKLLRPIHDADGSFVMTPMEQGIRVTCGVELAARDAPSNFSQLDTVVPLARSVIEFGDAVGERWRGARPTLPDSLPMIGPAPRHRGLWLAFGNQHIGFTTGPGTGAAIAAMIAGSAPPFDTQAFAPSRYIA
ncbi:FAD-binding oxidoreductase [Bradyrhizobium sp. ISRA443]|uniref:NAD(P)/FAD-dependent oxidoreductase n=1 Tax=unclassified Bradyrhizobium TaxID=2631580 RepID=UPI00247A86B0|nr:MULTISPECIES: FAD-dependent oxidoreductase [unclassified Bradyrhizobium]WGS01333.1 FAD-binding oxidoreductase [Bradyrhizobium sp. ISRA436]WGS08220.1 FAD-binding oxidoreductase [Bradyrhizobium sp. ISRA437]WGS15108.1 FAD-binding oxidoreductase [Bradyrhizobium sp. ISRA443]